MDTINCVIFQRGGGMTSKSKGRRCVCEFVLLAKAIIVCRASKGGFHSRRRLYLRGQWGLWGGGGYGVLKSCVVGVQGGGMAEGNWSCNHSICEFSTLLPDLPSCAHCHFHQFLILFKKYFALCVCWELVHGFQCSLVLGHYMLGVVSGCDKSANHIGHSSSKGVHSKPFWKPLRMVRMQNFVLEYVVDLNVFGGHMSFWAKASLHCFCTFSWNEFTWRFMVLVHVSLCQ